MTPRWLRPADAPYQLLQCPGCGEVRNFLVQLLDATGKLLVQCAVCTSIALEAEVLGTIE